MTRGCRSFIRSPGALRPLLLGLGVIYLGFLSGCGSGDPRISQSTASPEPSESSAYLIRPGDELDIKFFYSPELNETVLVRPDGKISLQLLDDVQAAGLTPAQLDQIITEHYAKELRDPSVTVIVRSFSGQQVFVGGEVGTPGMVNLVPGMTPLQAVINAGGFKETAKLEAALVIRKGEDEAPHPIRVDLKQALYGRGPAAGFTLKPYDIVYVPKTFIAKANQFVRQYIEELLLFRGVTFSFWYGLYDPSNK